MILKCSYTGAIYTHDEKDAELTERGTPFKAFQVRWTYTAPDHEKSGIKTFYTFSETWARTLVQCWDDLGKRQPTEFANWRWSYAFVE